METKDKTNVQFVTKSTEDLDLPQKIKNIVALDAYLVQYTDGNGENGVRVVFKVPGSDHAIILRESIGGSRVVSNAASWFKAELDKILQNNSSGKNSASDDDGVESY
jgi:hypothetical protein